MTSSHYAHAYHRALRHPVHLAIQQCRHQVGVSDIGALSPQPAVRQARRAFVSEQKRYGLCCPIPWLPHGIVTAVAMVGLAAVARRYCVVGISDDWSKNLAFVFFTSLFFKCAAVLSSSEPAFLRDTQKQVPLRADVAIGEKPALNRAVLHCALHGPRTVWAYYADSAKSYGISDPSTD